MKNTKQNILFLVTEINFGGVQIEALEMMKLISKNEFNVFYFVGHGGALSNAYLETEQIDGKIYLFDKNKYSLKEILTLYRFIKSRKINIIVSFSVKYSLLLTFLKPLLIKVSYIYRHSGIIFNYKMHKFKFLFNKSIEFLNITSHRKTIAVCPSNAKKLIKNYPSLRNKITWVSTYYNPIKFKDRDKFLDREYILNKHKIHKDSFIICCPQSFVKEKNQIELLKIFQTFKRNKNNCNIIFCGDGPNLLNVRKYVIDNNLHDSVFFLGSISNVEYYISGSDVICSTSYYMEGLPQICSQANFCKTPMIFYDWEGVQDELVHNENGFLIPFGNKDEFINKLIYLSNNKSFNNLINQETYNLPHDQENLEYFISLIK